MHGGLDYCLPVALKVNWAVELLRQPFVTFLTKAQLALSYVCGDMEYIPAYNFSQYYINRKKKNRVKAYPGFARKGNFEWINFATLPGWDVVNSRPPQHFLLCFPYIYTSVQVEYNDSILGLSQTWNLASSKLFIRLGHHISNAPSVYNFTHVKTLKLSSLHQIIYLIVGLRFFVLSLLLSSLLSFSIA